MAISVRPGDFLGAEERAHYGGAFDIRSLAVRPCGQQIELHTHAEAHFLLVLSGVYLSTAQGAPETARAPFLVFDPPGTTHRDRFAGDAGAFLAIALSADAFAACGADALPKAAVALNQPTALAAALRIARDVRAAAGDAVGLESSAWELVGAADGHEPGRGAPGWAHFAYEAVMDEASDSELSVGGLAACVGVHPVHLARVFRQVWGCTPGDLIRWRRLDRASDLLKQTRLPAAEIAAAVGFVDQAHMTRAFRARYGLTPGAWRRGHDVAPIQDEAAATA